MASTNPIDIGKAYNSDELPPFLSVFLNSSDAVVVTNDGWKLMYLNQGACSLSGYTKDELLSRKITDYFEREPDQDQDIITGFRQLTEGIALSFSHRVRRRNGTLMDVKVNASRINEGLYLFLIIDQTTYRPSEVETKFRNLVERSQVGVYIIQEGRFVYVNPRFAEIFGYTQHEMEGLPALAVVDKSEIEKVDRNIKARIEGKVEYVHYETIGVKKDGTIIYTEAYGSHTFFQGTSAIIGCLLDITERKKAELQNRQKTDQLSAISNNLPDALVYQLVADAEGNMQFTYLSEGVRKLTGMSPEETMANPESFYHVINDGDAGRMRKAEIESFRDLTLLNLDVRMRLLSGEERLMNMRSTPQQLPDGGVLWNGLITDITERKKAEEDILTLSRLYLLKSKVNELLLTATSKEAILSSLCEIAVTYGNFRMAWIGFYDADQNKIVPFNSAGYDYGYLDSVRSNPLKSSAESNTPIGRAVRTGMAHCSNDIANDPGLVFWREEAMKRNFLSSAAIPIKVNHEIVAVLALYVSQTWFFTDAEMDVLQNITRSIAFGLEKIRVDEEKSKAEAALLENIQVNKAMIAAFPDKVFRIQHDGTVVYIHAGSKTKLYRPADEMMSRKVSDIVPGVVSELIMSGIQKSLADKTIVQIEYAVMQEGKLHYLEGRAVPIEIPGEEQVLYIVRDITEEKDAEAALRESHKQTADYRYAIDQASLVDISDIHGVITYVNDRFCEVSGYTRDELIGKNHDILDSGYHPPAFFEQMQATLAKGEVWRDEICEKTKSGKLYWVDTTIVPFFDANGQPFQHMILRIDITQRKNAEEALKASEEKFRTLIEKTQLGVYILQDGKMQFVNPTLEKTIGYSKDEMVGIMSFSDLIHPDDRERVEQNVRIRMAGEIPKDIRPVRLISKNGKIIVIDTISSLISYEGRPAVIGTAIDITGKVAEEERITRAVSDAQEKERQQIGIELHDNVKQLMVACDIRLAFIQTKLDNRQKTEEHLQVSRDIIARAISDLRDISHQLTPIIEGGLPLDQSVALLIKRMDLHSLMKVHTHCDESVRILPKEVHLTFYRILQEQLNNVVKYARANTVHITVQDKNDHICMRIVDDGAGFDTTLKVEGIGFENMRRRIKLLHGQLTIISTPGYGCEVDIRIPKQ